MRHDDVDKLARRLAEDASAYSALGWHAEEAAAREKLDALRQDWRAVVDAADERRAIEDARRREIKEKFERDQERRERRVRMAQELPALVALAQGGRPVPLTELVAVADSANVSRADLDSAAAELKLSALTTEGEPGLFVGNLTWSGFGYRSAGSVRVPSRADDDAQERLEAARRGASERERALAG
jgi:hypothetical protein